MDTHTATLGQCATFLQRYAEACSSYKAAERAYQAKKHPLQTAQSIAEDAYNEACDGAPSVLLEIQKEARRDELTRIEAELRTVRLDWKDQEARLAAAAQVLFAETVPLLSGLVYSAFPQTLTADADKQDYPLEGLDSRVRTIYGARACLAWQAQSWHAPGVILLIANVLSAPEEEGDSLICASVACNLYPEGDGFVFAAALARMAFAVAAVLGFHRGAPHYPR